MHDLECAYVVRRAKSGAQAWVCELGALYELSCARLGVRSWRGLSTRLPSLLPCVSMVGVCGVCTSSVFGASPVRTLLFAPLKIGAANEPGRFPHT